MEVKYSCYHVVVAMTHLRGPDKIINHVALKGIIEWKKGIFSNDFKIKNYKLPTCSHFYVKHLGGLSDINNKN